MRTAFNEILYYHISCQMLKSLYQSDVLTLKESNQTLRHIAARLNINAPLLLNSD